jgi:hypothetical protein
MKKMIFILIALPFFSCNSDKKKDAPASENNYPAAQNATGNIPDTTNSINMGNKTDTGSSKDSIHK